MSTRARRRKRQYTVDLSNDDDEIEVIEVKRNRPEDGETVFQRIRYIAKYFEEHILYNRYIKALLSAIGYYNEDTSLEIVEDFEDDEWMDAPEQEENSPPCSSPVKPDFNDMANFFRSSSRIDEGTALKNSVNYRKYGRHHNTFVTLRRPLDLCETSSKKVNSMVDHKGRPLTSELHKTTLKGKSSRSILKSANLCHGNSPSSSFRSTQTIDLTQDEDVSSATSKTIPVHYDDDDDVQILSHEKKDVFNGFSSLTSEMDRHHIDYSSCIRPCGGLNGIRDLGKYHGLKTSPKSTSLKCAKLKNGFCPKISSPKLTSKTHFLYDEMRNSPNKASFTTDEVIRIQEKEQYKELLQKVCYEQSGHCKFDLFPHTASSRARSKKSNFHEEPVSHFRADISMKKTDVSSARALKTRISSFNSFKTIPEKDEVQIIECIPKTSNEDRLSGYVSSSSSSHSPDIIIENDTIPKVKEQRYQHESCGILSSSKSDSVSAASLNSFEGSFSGFNNRKRTPFISSNKQLSIHQTKKEITAVKPTKNFFSTTKPTEIILEEEEDVPLMSTKNDCKTTNKQSTQFSCAYTLNDIDLRVSSDLPAIICEDDDLHIGKQEKKISVSQQTKSPVFSTNWIEDLRKTIQEEDQERSRCVKDHERQFKEFREKSALKSEKFKDVLEREEKPSLDFQHDIYIEKEVLLPKLSPDKEALIDKILLPHAPNDVICNISNYSVLWKDIETLTGSNWLNDEIINVYMLLIQERSKLPNFPTVYAFTSFFYPKLRAQGYQAVRRWTRKVDIFAVDIIFVPLHLGVHWCLGVIDNRYKRIQYYDSMDGNENCLGLLRDYLVSECLDKKKTDFDTSGWVLEKMKDIPPQLNGSDCGMFTLKYAEYISRNAKITFTQQNMQYFRRKMVYEIVKGKII